MKKLIIFLKQFFCSHQKIINADIYLVEWCDSGYTCLDCKKIL